MLGRLSLRARLVLGVIVLTAIGLVAADIATYTSLRSFLFDRVDNTLDSAHPSIEQAVFGGGAGPNPLQTLAAIVPGDCIEVRALSGQVVGSRCIARFPDEAAAPPPRLPKSISLPAKPNTPDGDRVHRLTVGATRGGDRYRVRASIEPRASNYLLVISAPLSSVDSTLHRLFLIELLVTVAVLAALAGLGLWVIRLGLRPLREIEGTAAAIAAGDLTQRVERAEERTEVGRLGLALNAMLGQIESAFRAREASEARLRRFVADASHELRTPLSAVRAYAELFERGAGQKPNDLARAMGGIARESQRMSLLVEDLLLLARLDEGRPLEREPVDLEQVVGEAVETAKTVEPDRPIEFTAEHAVVLGDRERLRQVVDNLLSNVRAHTPRSAPVRVDVSTSDGQVVLEVEDSGAGLTQEQLEQVFERFYRADPSRSQESGGVGLGLSIVAAVVAAHGGSATASSKPGKGAAFAVSLPLYETP
jgi:two-component system OmpR family sensor kinase